jgi:NAD(P)H-dependent FMN reductase
MKTIILTGSVRKGRQSHKAAHYIAGMLKGRNVETDLIDLTQTPLPILGTQEAETSEAINNIARVGARITEADALIFVTPEYHGSFSGVLKNALEHYWEEFQKKPVAVVAASSGRMGGINASTQLQHVILSLGAFPMPYKLLISEIHNAFDESGKPKNERIIKSTAKFLDELLWFAGALYRAKREPEAMNTK